MVKNIIKNYLYKIKTMCIIPAIVQIIHMRIKDTHTLPRVLTTLVNATIALSGATPRHAGSVYKAFRKFDELQRISDEQLRQTVRYAIGKKYITITHRGEKNSIQLTKEGKKLAGHFAVTALKLTHTSAWDKKWRVVMFDIPETHKKARDGFAANLKRVGFVKIQKSVFVYPHQCFEELEVLMDFHNVQQYVTCLVSTHLTPDKEIKKFFGLK